MENENSSDSSLTYVEKFENERTEWTKTIKDMSVRLRDIDNLTDLQVDLYSRRQEAVEYMYKLASFQGRFKKTMAKMYAAEYEKIVSNEDYRYSEREKQKLVEEKLICVKVKMDDLQNHIDFFRESIKTMDSMIFGIKHRMEIEDFKRGNR